VAGGVAGGLSCISGYFRLFFYLFELPYHLFLYMIYRFYSNKVCKIISFSPIFYDEIIWFPLPLLDQMLRFAYKENHITGLKYISYVNQNKFQKKTALKALAWITADEINDIDNLSLINNKLNKIKWLPDNLSELGTDVAEFFPYFQAIGDSLNQSGYDQYSKKLTFRNALEQLDTISIKLDHAGRFAKERWQPAVDCWHKIISDELFKLDSIKIERMPNPYQTGNPIQRIRQTLFKGRKELKDEIVNSLLEHDRPTIVLHGPRRMGKTSFLLQLPALLPAHTIPVFVDLQRPSSVQNNASFLFQTAKSISTQARPRKIIIPPPIRDDFFKSPFDAFEEWIEEKAIPAIMTFQLLITFDEFEKLGQAIANEKMDYSILDQIRNLIQHQTQMAFLFAGVQTMDDLGENWSSYFINTRPISIGYLKDEEAHELITNPDYESDFNLKYDTEVIQSIKNFTKCHPYLIQLVCKALVDIANEMRTDYANINMLSRAIDLSLKQGAPYFRNVWDEMVGIEGHEILCKIAQSETPVEIPTNDKVLKTALTKMVKHKILSQINDNKFKVEIPIIRKWVLEQENIL